MSTPTPYDADVDTASDQEEPVEAREPAPELAAAVDLAWEAAQQEAGSEVVGQHVDVLAEDDSAATHLFAATHPGYVGWRWAVTLAHAGPGSPVTVSEVVLLPGPDALVAPEWLPWDQRVRAGDLGVGDLLPTPADDPRLVPGYLASDDPAIEDVARELGLGRHRVLGRHGRVEIAERWVSGEFGPDSDMAKSAPGNCGTCGFYLPLDGSLGAAFGACGNELAPADSRVVHVEYGCGAHSEAEGGGTSPVPIAEVVYDDAGVDLIPVGTVNRIAEGERRPTKTSAGPAAAGEPSDPAPELAGPTAPASQDEGTPDTTTAGSPVADGAGEAHGEGAAAGNAPADAEAPAPVDERDQEETAPAPRARRRRRSSPGSGQQR
ncbi:DUF3027 domain-containing protein [Actinoalloteichus caeruleus]|uniref:DUF3027 family protein n=1 Tax=Actinoalloteichus caeruleus DSM 43889 TaxID=1120930 RepID=A0ABT1JJR6_ACTCY|nr:DUF3027 domain-containing protein [Actinoalloteichus caeruleus]MCP2332539.1 Protein of unknown function (DUF3027) [Actinoalloteichus caeruleus DSM 43889]